MAVTVQVVFDAADPEALAQFWASAAGYVIQPPPEGFESWQAFLAQIGVPEDQWDKASACVDPDGHRAAVLLPEGARAQGGEEPRARRLPAGCAAMIRPSGLRSRGPTRSGQGSAPGRCPGSTRDGEFWIVLADPEGNEFCVS